MPDLMAALTYQLEKFIHMDELAEVAFGLSQLFKSEGVRQDPENDDAIILPDGRRFFVSVSLKEG